MTSPATSEKQGVAARLAASGIRPTRQRVGLARLLFGEGDRHVRAEQLRAEAERAGLRVSLATVYNTLNEFTRAGLLRELVVAPGRSYFDTNTDPHHHFLHEADGRLQDVPAAHLPLPALPALPPGTALAGIDVVIRLRADPGR